MPATSSWPALPLPRWTDAGGDRKLQPRARATRQAVLVAASSVVAERGYSGTSLRDITQCCGATKGAVYFHFRSKDELAEAIVIEVFAAWEDLIARIEDLELDPLLTLMACYDAYAGRLMYDASARAALRIVQEEIGRHHAASWSARWERTVEGLLVQALDRGLISPGIDPAWLSRLLLATATGHFQLAENRPTGPNMWKRMNDVWGGLLPAVATAPWLAIWRESGWSDRPEPESHQYDLS